MSTRLDTEVSLPQRFIIFSPVFKSVITSLSSDKSDKLPVYWKYASIYDYDVSVSGSVISISKKDGSSISNLGITTLGDEFTEVIVTSIIVDIEEEYQLNNYKPKCSDLEELLISIPTTESRTDLLNNVSDILSCEEGQVISSLPRENNLIVVGASGDNGGGSDRGAAYIFEQQRKHMERSTEVAKDMFSYHDAEEHRQQGKNIWCWKNQYRRKLSKDF